MRQSNQRRLAKWLRQGFFGYAASDTAIAIFKRMNADKIEMRDAGAGKRG